MPSVRINSRNTSAIPEYLPAGAIQLIKQNYINIYNQIKPVWNLDLSTSGGIATTQLAIPAIPPANNVFNALKSLVLQ